MSALGKVSIGRKAPYFRCEAVIKGAIKEVSLSTYIKPSIKPGTQNHDAPWLIIMFIPAAFSFVCPTEVLAFQNCLDEFIGRNCNIVFVSVDTKHSLWHWQNVPRQYGGLGPIDIPLLSDSNHRLAKDYGVLMEDEGVSMRGMFIIDGEGLVQQITLNNLSVGRSVLEALRLLEAFQAVARHGVLCPIDWKSSKNNSEATGTTSDTLAESYEERFANLQKEFGDIQVTDLDAKQKSNDSPSATNSGAKSNNDDLKKGTPAVTVRPTRSHSKSERPSIRQVSCSRPKHPSPLNSHHNDYLPHTTSQSLSILSESSPSPHLSSAPQTANTTPTSTPTTSQSPTTKLQTMPRHARGMHPQVMDAHYMNSLFCQSAPSLFRPFIKHKSTASASASDTDSQSGPSTAPPTAPPTPLLRSRSKSSSSLPPRLIMHNTHESMSGDQVLLEFADPTDTPPSPSLVPHIPATTRATKLLGPRARARAATYASSSSSTRWPSASPDSARGHVHTPPVSQTMIQTAFDAIKKMGSGLGSPRSPRRSGCGSETGTGTDEDGKGSGYFDVIIEGEAT